MSRRDPKPLPKAETLNSLLDLNAATGELRWRARPCSCFPSYRACRVWNARFTGQRAGSVNKGTGRRIIRLFDQAFLASRVIFTMANGRDPGLLFVDHKNRNESDDRPDNLRTATQAQNAINRDAKSKAASGIRGVKIDPRNASQFVAQIVFRKRQKYLGAFKTPEEAQAAYDRAAAELYGEFASGGGVAS